MSDTDSFIDEVTEEVRRDRLFHVLRRYGWIGAVVVVAIVGGTTLREINRAKEETAAQELGDAMTKALEPADAAERAALLADVPSQSAAETMLVNMARAGALVEAGNTDDAIALYQAIASNGDVAAIYRNIASFKALILQGNDLNIDERRLQFNALASPGAPLASLAIEQLALLEIEDGNADAAITLLRGLTGDATVSADLQDRARQLIVALGGDAQ